MPNNIDLVEIVAAARQRDNSRVAQEQSAGLIIREVEGAIPSPATISPELSSAIDRALRVIDRHAGRLTLVKGDKR